MWRGLTLYHLSGGTIVMAEDGSVWWSVCEPQISGYAPKSFGTANKWIVGGAVAYLFASHSVLLVGEGESSVLDACDAILVIQRRCGGGVDGAAHGENNISELEGFASCLASRFFEVFGWAGEPEEGDDDEVNDSTIEGAIGRVIEVESFEEVSDDGDIAGVGSGRRLVVVSTGFDVAGEEVVHVVEVDIPRVSRPSGGIWWHQVGDARAHRQ